MARAIDADALKKALSEAIKDAPLYIQATVEQYIDEAPTLTPPNEWVSVEPKMPPENERVLCIVNGSPRSNITLEDAYQLGSWSESDGWIIDEWPDWEGANVVWWRPLPAPPESRPPEGEA